MERGKDQGGAERYLRSDLPFLYDIADTNISEIMLVRGTKMYMFQERYLLLKHTLQTSFVID